MRKPPVGAGTRRSTREASPPPSQRFLRFARALALVSSAAPFGCGSRALDHTQATNQDGAAGGGGGATIVTTGTAGFMGIWAAPQDAANNVDQASDLVVVTFPPYDGPVPGGVMPYPQYDAGIDAYPAEPRADASDAQDATVRTDAVAVDRIPIPVGGPQAAPAWPPEAWASEPA